MKGGEEADLFDAESDCFSALHSESDSSVSLGSRVNSLNPGGSAIMNEKDLDGIDVNLISLTNQNKDF